MVCLFFALEVDLDFFFFFTVHGVADKAPCILIEAVGFLEAQNETPRPQPATCLIQSHKLLLKSYHISFSAHVISLLVVYNVQNVQERVKVGQVLSEQGCQ